MIHHHDQARQRQQQAGDARRFITPFHQRQGQDGLRPQQGGQHARRNAVVQGQQIADGIDADQQQAGCRDHRARARRGQPALAVDANQQQHRQRQEETQQQKAEGRRMRQPPFGEDCAGAPQQHEQGCGPVSGPRDAIRKHEISPVRVCTGSRPIADGRQARTRMAHVCRTLKDYL
ncbi:hypothetical protein D3C85_1259600 [compost metagenome]